MSSPAKNMNKTAGKYHAVRKRKMTVILILAALLVLSMILALGIGSVFIPPGDVLLAIGNALFPALISAPEGAADIVLNFRMPRILLAVLTGVALAAAGAVMQGLL
ncbi:iron chelate uptake ABC transporter family permease subunit, partial [Methanocorpusculaceae archaeon]|nr:iron chelate uptake ABC transporter family permease subunit [Methanocorpusculaceae archaeon]